jgi:hypothetical protein
VIPDQFSRYSRHIVEYRTGFIVSCRERWKCMVLAGVMKMKDLRKVLIVTFMKRITKLLKNLQQSHSSPGTLAWTALFRGHFVRSRTLAQKNSFPPSPPCCVVSALPPTPQPSCTSDDPFFFPLPLKFLLFFSVVFRLCSHKLLGC